MANGQVLVVGAGPTGMTAAIELRRAGIDVRIVDRSPHMAEHSQALVVQARTLEQFQRYGIADRAVARGHKLRHGVFHSDGKLIADIELEGIASRYPFALTLPQSETEALLNEKMESLGAHAERGTELTTLTERNGTIIAELRRGDGALERTMPRWVIGCDGAHSGVREMLGVPFEGASVDLSFFLADVEIDGPDAPNDEIALFLHRGDVVFLARLNKRLTRMIVVDHADREQRQKDPAIADFQRAADEAGMHIRIHGSAWMTPFHVNDRQARSYRIGNVFLAGDASHIHSPAGGQGMNTGIQDVANLVWKLAAVERGAPDILLDSYEEERGEVGKALLRFTGRGMKLATASNPVTRHLRDALLPLLTKAEPVQKAMLGFISETAIEYRSSAIVADHGGDGDLRAGDRLPDLSMRDGSALLGNWAEAKHWAILLGGAAAETEQLATELPESHVSALPVQELDDEGRALLGKEKKLLILRPDGYVGFRGPVEKPGAWRAYAHQDAIIRMRKPAQPAPEERHAHV